MKVLDKNGVELTLNDRVSHGTTASPTTTYEGMVFELKPAQRITDNEQIGPKTYINPPQVYVLYDMGETDHFNAWETKDGTYQVEELEVIG